MAQRWYSVSVLSNFEKKIAEAIRTAAEEAGMQDMIEEVLVPTEEVIRSASRQESDDRAALHAGLTFWCVWK